LSKTSKRTPIFRKDGSFGAEHIYEKIDARNRLGLRSRILARQGAKEQKFIYMIDGMNGEVRLVDRAAKETLGRFGRPGRQIGQFRALHIVAVDRQGNIFTSEVNTGQRAQKFRRLDLQD
jgi:hypothetical protein